MAKKNVIYSLLLFLIIFTLYLTTLSPTVNWEDSGELQSASYTLSIAHPPGYPLYLIIGKLFSFIPLYSIEWRINLLSVIFSCLSCIILYTGIQKIIKKINISRYQILSFFIVLLFSISSTLWKTSLQTEVYSLHLFFFSLQLYLLILIFIEKKRKYHLLFAYITGLSLGNHHSAVFMLIIYTILILYKKEWKNFQYTDYIKTGALLLLGLSIYLYLPIRSINQPLLNWGDPSTLSNFFSHLLRKQYGDTGQFQLLSSGLIKNLSSINPVYEFFSMLDPILKISPLPLLLLLLILFFLYQGLKSIPLKLIKILFILTFIIHTLPFILFLQTPSDKLFTLKVFFIPGWISIYLFLILGIYKFFKKHIISILTIIFILLIIFNFSYQYSNKNYITNDYRDNILKNLPYKSVLFTIKDNETFPLWQSKYLYQIRPDIIIINIVILSEQWYIEQLIRNYPDLKITLPSLKGHFSKKDIRSKFFNNIINSQTEHQLFFTSNKLKKYLNTPVKLQSSGILYIKGTPLYHNPYFLYIQHIENQLTEFRKNIIKEQYKPSYMILDTQSKYMFQNMAFNMLNYANYLKDNKMEDLSIYYYKYSIFLNNIIDTSINNIYAYAYLGDIYIKKEKNKALYFYKKAIQCQPRSSLARQLLKKTDLQKNDTYIQIKKISFLAEKAYKQKNYQKAIQLYQTLLKITPEHPVINSNLGDCYYQLKQLEKAIHYYNTALQLKHDYIIAYYNLGGCYLLMGDKKKAKTIWQKGLKHAPNDPRLLNAIKQYF